MTKKVSVIRGMLYMLARCQSGAVREGLQGLQGFPAPLWVWQLRSSPRSFRNKGSYRSISPEAHESRGVLSCLWGMKE